LQDLYKHQQIQLFLTGVIEHHNINTISTAHLSLTRQAVAEVLHFFSLLFFQEIVLMVFLLRAFIRLLSKVFRKGVRCIRFLRNKPPKSVSTMYDLGAVWSRIISHSWLFPSQKTGCPGFSCSFSFVPYLQSTHCFCSSLFFFP
jgi:hypothetical protein